MHSPGMNKVFDDVEFLCLSLMSSPLPLPNPYPTLADCGERAEWLFRAAKWHPHRTGQTAFARREV